MSRNDAPMRLRRLPGRVLLYLVLTVLAVPFVFPVYWMIVTGLKPLSQVFANPPSLWPGLSHWRTYLKPFQDAPFGRQFWNSTYIATIATVGVLAISSLAGYAFARIRFRGSSFIFVLLLSSILIPAEVTIIPLFREMNFLGWIDTPLPLLAVQIFGGAGVLGTFIMRQFFLSLPVELEEAARLDGLSRFGIYWRIALPLSRPSLAAVAILAFLNSWNDFLDPLIFLRSRDQWTLPLALNSFTDPYTGTPIWNEQMAAASMSVIPIIVVFLFAQRQFVQGIAGTGIK
jgi:multiple sugar transport system permease protein